MNHRQGLDRSQTLLFPELSASGQNRPVESE